MNFQTFICFVIFFNQIVKSEEPASTKLGVPTGNFNKKFVAKTLII